MQCVAKILNDTDSGVAVVDENNFFFLLFVCTVVAKWSSKSPPTDIGEQKKRSCSPLDGTTIQDSHQTIQRKSYEPVRNNSI
jgi:hypothetical protein